MSSPLLLLTIDVEEDMPGWRVTNPPATTNVRELPRLAEACSALGVRPTYLCSYPVVTDGESAGILRELHARGGCEIGTHLHAWNTPPFLGVPGRDGDERNVPYYQLELEREAFRAKLERLHAAVARVSGREPVSFRAGRFGIDTKTLNELADFGYLADTSVTPLSEYTEDGGPDFRSAPRFPYRPSRADLTRHGDLSLIEIPVSVSLTRRLPEPLQRAYVRLPRATRLRGLLSRDWLGLVDYAWLYPVRFDLELMTRAADALVAQESPVLNVFLHSSELAPGLSGKVLTPRDAETCFESLRALLRHCREVWDAEPMTLAEAAARLGPGLGLEHPAAV